MYICRATDAIFRATDAIFRATDAIYVKLMMHVYM